MQYSKGFIRANWLALILLFLVVIAGSLVRITGSGMGCPDWPKCFGTWVPPTSVDQIPENYGEIYVEKRTEKLNRFIKMLRSVGFNASADRLENDPYVMYEQPFNARKTWIEYGNRLAGFLAGNVMLIVFFWIFFFYRRSGLIGVQFLNLILMGFQGWFGSIVVASNLVPWTITVHLLLALVIIGIQVYVLYRVSFRTNRRIVMPRWMYWSLVVCLVITVYQMFLGTQVRESIDDLTKLGYGRESWSEILGMPFYIHRSFSWLVLGLLTFIAFKNERGNRFLSVRLVYLTLAVSLITGVVLAHFNTPGLVQTSHLLFAVVLFGILLMIVFRGFKNWDTISSDS